MLAARHTEQRQVTPTSTTQSHGLPAKEQLRGLHLNSRYQVVHDEVISVAATPNQQRRPPAGVGVSARPRCGVRGCRYCGAQPPIRQLRASTSADVEATEQLGGGSVKFWA